MPFAPILSGLLMIVAVAAGAQDATRGHLEFLNSCAQCHGPEGRGGGTITPFLTMPPPDLTLIQQANGGVFPVSALYALIDGSATDGMHGSGEMPAWGMRYAQEARGELGRLAGPGDVDAHVHARVMALIDHIASIQVE